MRGDGYDKCSFCRSDDWYFNVVIEERVCAKCKNCLGKLKYPTKKDTIVKISDAADGFEINIGDKHWWFDQEDTREKLTEVFEELGITSTYEED